MACRLYADVIPLCWCRVMKFYGYWVIEALVLRVHPRNIPDRLFECARQLIKMHHPQQAILKTVAESMAKQTPDGVVPQNEELTSPVQQSDPKGGELLEKVVPQAGDDVVQGNGDDAVQGNGDDAAQGNGDDAAQDIGDEDVS